MKLVNPRIGPVLGLVTKTSAKIMCGIQHCEIDTDKLNCGWIRYRKDASGHRWSKAFQFRFNRNFYYTGVIELTDLEPEMNYEYQMAYNSDYSQDLLEDSDLWDDVEKHDLKTHHSDDFRFCFGSCLRNNKNDSRVGKSLIPVMGIHADKKLDMMLWLGDQVYNDKYLEATLNNSSINDFTELYEEFFSNDYVKAVLPKIPNYMVMDDHEIENSFTDGVHEYSDTNFNWLNRNKDRLINGINAFYSYQASHGPIFDTQKSDTKGVSYVKGQDNNQVPVKHYASIDFGDVGLFLMDTRKERSDGELISIKQEQLFKDFLSSDYRVKLVASSVTFLADNHKKPEKTDNWKKAANQRERILNYIISKDIQNVIFLSGDVHSHFAVSLNHQSSKTTIHQLVSGSLFWPTSFLMDRIRWFEDDVAFNQPLHGAEGFSVSSPLSKTDTVFYASNAVGYVEILNDKLIFKVIKQDNQVLIDAELPLM